MHLRLTLFVVALAGLLPLSACGGKPAAAGMPLPAELDNASAEVREAYQYAMTNHAELAKYPCYCGCVDLGHTSNRDCYIDEILEDGTIKLDYHAVACDICGDITRDVARLREQGFASITIREYIDTKYSPYGPSTNTPFPLE
jgi:hypothetical protein